MYIQREKKNLKSEIGKSKKKLDSSKIIKSESKKYIIYPKSDGTYLGEIKLEKREPISQSHIQS